jgi:hypothetical protein
MATTLFAGNPQVWASYNLTLNNKQYDVQMKQFLLQLSQWATLIQLYATPGSYYNPGGGGAALQIIWGEIPGGTVNGVNKNFTSLNPFRPNLIAVFLNGLRQRRTDDYTETGSNSFQFVNAPLSGDILSIDYIQP